MKDLQEVLMTRRTVYKFTDQQIDDSIILQAINAASMAPCHKNTHPWRFSVIGNKTRDTLIPTIRRLAEQKSIRLKSHNIEHNIQRAIKKIISPPLLVAITSKKNDKDKFREKEDYAASVCALHNMVLSFWNNGVGSQWSTGSITRELETYQILSIEPTNEEIIGFLKIGYPESLPKVKKLSVQEITTNLE